MKKILIIVGILAVTGVILFGINVKIIVEESKIFTGDRTLLYKNVSKFENFRKWSPWEKLDPTQTVRIEGQDGEVGAQLFWDSDDDNVGHGSQKITSISPNQIDMELIFTAPWQSTSKVYYVFKDVDGGTELTWGFEGEGPIMQKLFVGPMLSKQYQSGLATLATLLNQ